MTRAGFLHKVIKYIAKATLRTDSLDAIIQKGILDNHWVEAIHIRGLDTSNRICAEIVLRIDWDRHRLHVKDGKHEIEYDASKTPGDNLSRKVDAVIDIYSEIVTEQGLRGAWAITYVEGIDRSRARQELGTSPSEHKWKDGTISHVGGLNDKKLDEFFADLSIVVQDADADRSGILKGTVIGFFELRGYGFIRPEKPINNKDVFFHISNVINSEKVAEGSRVQFTLESGAKGPRAVNVQIL